MRLILVRHGQTPSNVIGSLDTAVPGPGLTELGHRQAAAVPAALAGETIGAIYVSNLTRTHLTAAPLAVERGLEPLERAGIRELSAGHLEGRTDAEAVGEFFGIMQQWHLGDLSVAVPGGESGQEVLDRYDAVVQEMADSGVPTVAAFSHGGVIRLWAASRAANTEAVAAGQFRLANTGIVVLIGEPGNWTCESWQSESTLDS